MAIINKTGITNGGTVQAEHVTRAIDALSGVSTDTIIATGSFSGSLTGIATSATSASYAVTASYATNAGSGVTIDNNTNNYIVTATGTANTLNGEANLTFDGNTLTTSNVRTVTFANIGSSGAGLVIPTSRPDNPINGSMYWEDGNSQGRLYIYSSLNDIWLNVTIG
jgi:hypothetical protein